LAIAVIKQELNCFKANIQNGRLVDKKLVISLLGPLLLAFTNERRLNGFSFIPKHFLVSWHENG
jgi:hypothetical protein